MERRDAGALKKGVIAVDAGLLRRWAILALLVQLFVLSPAFGQPRALSDEELDQVVAQGVDFTLKMTPDEQFVDFKFDMGQTFGNGSIGPSSFAFPPNVVVNGNGLSLNALHVENLILNLNICMGCTATTIIQQGLAFPITIKTQP